MLVRQYAGPAQGAVEVEAQTLPFQVTDVKVDQGGDSRWVTITVTGARFSSEALLKLVRPGIEEIVPSSFSVVDATKIIATFDFTGKTLGLYDVSVTNPSGAEATLPYRFLIEPALPIDTVLGLGGPRIVPAGSTGLYGVSLQSVTNVDTPYVYFSFGAPEMGENPKVGGLPFLTTSSNVGGNPDGVRTDVPWVSLDSEVNSNGFMLAPGYALDVAAGGYVGMSFNVTTYPGFAALIARDPEGVRVALENARAYWPKDKLDALINNLTAMINDPNKILPDDCWPTFIPFRFNIMATATPMSRNEFITRQIGEALTMRDRILADSTASVALVNLAADAHGWVASYLGALEQGGLLRQELTAPPIRTKPKVVSTLAVLASGVLVGPGGQQMLSNADLVAFFSKVHEWYGDKPGTLSPIAGFDARITQFCGEYNVPIPALPKAADYDLNLPQQTYFETFNIFTPYGNATDSQYASVLASSDLAPLQLQALLDGAGQSNAAAYVSAPQGYGVQQFLPVLSLIHI